MRAFIAVEISERARTEVARLQERLRAAGADVKWVDPENLHLTLKFLGEVPEEKIPALTESLGRTAAEISPFSFSLQGVGAFPGMEHPRVIWVGIGEGNDRLAKLGIAVEKTCAGLGFPAEERPFSPHLTIGRVRSGKELSRLAKQMEKVKFRATEPEQAEWIVLLESTLGSGGPVYRTIGEIFLKSH